jgi:hypothetical protein
MSGAGKRRESILSRPRRQNYLASVAVINNNTLSAWAKGITRSAGARTEKKLDKTKSEPCQHSERK